MLGPAHESGGCVCVIRGVGEWQCYAMCGELLGRGGGRRAGVETGWTAASGSRAGCSSAGDVWVSGRVHARGMRLVNVSATVIGLLPRQHRQTTVADRGPLSRLQHPLPTALPDCRQYGGLVRVVVHRRARRAD